MMSNNLEIEEIKEDVEKLKKEMVIVMKLLNAALRQLDEQNYCGRTT